LSYLSVYGPIGCLDLDSLTILFGNNSEVEGGSGCEEIRFLDLTGLLNPRYTLAELKKSLPPTSARASLGGAPSASTVNQKGKEKVTAEVAESWEDEVDETTTPPLPTTLSIPIFTNLTRLSLAHPGENASWSDLLAISPRLKALTHLSLAYWPTPSTTPNAAIASMVSKHTNPVSLGGSHFYSELDDDWHEAASILRRLSKNTYRLKWLDLEGCTWHTALTWDHFDRIRERAGTPPSALGISTDAWVTSAVQPGPDWNGAWGQIEYVNLFQGWIPSDLHGLRHAPAGVLPMQLLSWLREHKNDPKYRHKLRDDGGDELAWVEREKVARMVADDIQKARMNGKWCHVDHGWEPVYKFRRSSSEDSA
jgi:hypothetical protein